MVWQKISKDKQRPICFILYVRSLHERNCQTQQSLPDNLLKHLIFPYNICIRKDGRRLVICKFGKIYLPIWWSPENLIIYVNRMPFISEHSNKMPFSSYNIFENHLDRGLSGFKSFLERDFSSLFWQNYCFFWLFSYLTFEVFLNKVTSSGIYKSLIL